MNHLTPTSLQDASHFRTRWAAIVPAETTLEDALNPAFWLHVATKLRRMDIIEVIPESEEWFAELIVVGVGTGSVKTIVLNKVEIEPAIEIDPELTTEIKWGGPADRYRVVRKSDGVVVSKNHTSKASARIWQDSHERALAA